MTYGSGPDTLYHLEATWAQQLLYLSFLGITSIDLFVASHSVPDAIATTGWIDDFNTDTMHTVSYVGGACVAPGGFVWNDEWAIPSLRTGVYLVREVPFATPEPSTLLLSGLGAACSVTARWTRRGRQSV